MAYFGNYFGAVLQEGSVIGSGDTPVTADTLDDEGDDMYVLTSGDVGIDDVLVRAYVNSEWEADPTTAAIRAETHTDADGAWEFPLFLDSGVNYAIVFAKSGYTFEQTTVTP